MSYTLSLRQRFTVVQNRYDVLRGDGSASVPLAYAQQKRFSLREKIIFYTPETSSPAFALTARNIVDLAGVYDITDAGGNVLATLRKDALASLARSTFQLEFPHGSLTGRERTWWRPIARRVLSAVNELGSLIPIHFDFTDASGVAVLSVERRLAVRDSYRILVERDDFDWRVAAACAVAVDTLMNR